MSTKKIFHVFVRDNRHVRYTVEAESQEEAQKKVESSENADQDFGFKTVDSEWYVDEIRDM